MPSPANDPFPGVIGTFMGRDALRLAAASLDLQPADTVLLPAYLCVEVLKPFQARCQVRFFDVTPDASIDPAVLADLLSAHRPKAVLFINYFGWLQPQRAMLKQLCAAHKAILIEDCAHSLLTEGSGETGDWVIHSFRKVLPIPDGGGLKTNTSAGRLKPRFKNAIVPTLLSLAILLKSRLRLTQEVFSRSGLAPSQPAPAATSAEAGVPKVHPMSCLTRRLMRRLDFPALTARRRQDYQFWLDLTARIPGAQPLFAGLPSGVCPMGFTVLLPDRETIKHRLESQGMTIRTHWRLPAVVGAEHTNSHHLSSRSLTFPLGHELTEAGREAARQLVQSITGKTASPL